MQAFNIRFNLVSISCISILISYNSNLNILVQIGDGCLDRGIDLDTGELS